MRNLRWQILIAVGGLLLVIGLLIGQSPGDVSPSAQPQPGGVYTEALVGQVQRLNPLLDWYNQPDQDIDRLIYSGLVRFDARGVPVPDLATWTVTADATIYTFTIKENAEWHDGTPVTVDDIIFTFSKITDEDFPGPADLAEFWAQIEIIPLDDHNVQFILPEPFAPFLDYVSVPLLPDHLLRGVSAGAMIDHPFNLDPIGSGPFRFDQFIVSEGEITGVSLVSNPDFYDDPPFLDRVEFVLFPSSEAAYQAYTEGEVTGISRVDTDTLEAVLADPGLNLHSARVPRVEMVFINTQNQEKQYLSDKLFRQALLYAINRQYIIDMVEGGQGLMPSGPLMPGSWAHSQDIPLIEFDPDESERILTDLGWEPPAGAQPGTPDYIRTQEDVTLSLELIYPDDALHGQIAIMLQRNWQAVGIAVTLTPVDPAAMLSDFLQPRTYEVALTTFNLSHFPDPDPYPFWHDSQAETGQNYSAFQDRNTSIWLEQARIVPDIGRRTELYRSFQARFLDQVPAIFLYYHVYNFAIDAEYQGVTIGPMFDPSDRFNTIRQWYLIERIGLQPAEEQDQEQTTTE
ncbi:MAG: peptide ABC transporter substrate-binding protein [Anaerolineales bacterium]|jgi:peptide/nickel transport system substrate-binding protein